MSDAKTMTNKQRLLVTLIGIVFLLLLVSLAVSGGGASSNQQVEIDRETCLQRGGVWSETNQECYNSTAVNPTIR